MFIQNNSNEHPEQPVKEKADRLRERDPVKKRVLRMSIFAMLGALMFCSKIIMEAFPNIHLLGMLTMVLTLTFRWRALIPIYVYVMLNGIFAGFDVWWFPYLYIWTILWAVTMLLPKKMPRWLCFAVYPIVCSLHGFAFGILYAPAQALFFGLSFRETMIWIAGGALFDTIHGISNFCVGFLIVPFSELLKKLVKRQNI